MCRPPRLISFFREMMWWENYPASSNSEHTRQKAALVCERSLDAAVVLLKLGENTPLDSQSQVKFAWTWSDNHYMLVSPENLKPTGILLLMNTTPSCFESAIYCWQIKIPNEGKHCRILQMCSNLHNFHNFEFGVAGIPNPNPACMFANSSRGASSHSFIFLFFFLSK